MKRMHDELFVFGRIVCKYKVPQEFIDDMNERYESALKKNTLLSSHGKNLAGRLDSELDVLPILQTAKIFNFLTQCMSDYVDTCIEYAIAPTGPHNLDILSCWMNDMKPGEYNPPHTHNGATCEGYACNLYLKLPEFINDVKEPHKFKDGRTNFVSPCATKVHTFLPEVGDFYIFQADHLHSVNPFKTKDPKAIRRSMPLNFVINNNVRGQVIGEEMNEHQKGELNILKTLPSLTDHLKKASDTIDRTRTVLGKKR